MGVEVVDYVWANGASVAYAGRVPAPYWAIESLPWDEVYGQAVKLARDRIDEINGYAFTAVEGEVEPPINLKAPLIYRIGRRDACRPKGVFCRMVESVS